jgi:hypoxanthine phosphoribosyltransferase
MTRHVPQHYSEIFSETQVQQSVRHVARELTPWVAQVHAATGDQPLALCVLRGAFLFFADLLRSVPHSIQPAFVRCQSYVQEENRQSDSIHFDLGGTVVKGRAILLADDICDTGRTLKVLSEHLLALGAREVKTAVLIHRRHPASVFAPDFACFRYDGPEWFAGYGMEDSHWRMNYPAVYTLNAQPPAA